MVKRPVAAHTTATTKQRAATTAALLDAGQHLQHPATKLPSTEYVAINFDFFMLTEVLTLSRKFCVRVKYMSNFLRPLLTITMHAYLWADLDSNSCH